MSYLVVPIPHSSPEAPPAARLVAKLMQEGYRPGAPSRVDLQARTADAEILQDCLCPNCLGAGLAYRPFVKGDSYRVIGLCQVCGAGEEF
jgi:hypothetical protein